MAESILIEQRKLQPSPKIELFTLDFATLGSASRLHFHNGKTQGFAPVVFQGTTYMPWPIEAEGFEMEGESLPTPTLTVANANALISQTMRQLNDFINAKLIRRRTFARFLDSGETPDPSQEYAPDIFYVSRKVSEKGDKVAFQLASSLDLRRVKIPLRQVQQNVCSHEYRDADCGYTGPYRDLDGNLTNNPAEDACSLLIKNGCKPRYGAHAVLPFGGCPGARAYV